MKTGIELIAQEREEHFTKHGISVGIDVIHNQNGQLCEAAQKLIVPDEFTQYPPRHWDKILWSKMISKTQKERLIIAGALIAAELDRLNCIKD